MTRPGAALLQSLVAEELRGRPGAAEQAARGAVRDDPARVAEHLLDAAYALLVAGEPKAAGATLAEIEHRPCAPEVVARVRACRSWADQLDRNWYPGNTGAERDDDALFVIGSVCSDDPETMLLEGCVAKGPVALLPARAVTDSAARQGAGVVRALLQSSTQTLQECGAVASAAGAHTTALWAQLAQVDLLWRCGLAKDVSELLSTVRQSYEQLGDRVGLACTFLTEGDWYAVPGSSPEALGFDLAQQHLPSAVAGAKDLVRAEACYAQAESLIDGLDTPRALGSLALRRAVLDRAAGRSDDLRRHLALAEEAFALSGDRAALQVLTVHGVLAELASDDVAAVRLTAGTGWDQKPRGPIAEVLAWATSRGSSSFAQGLGRLLQRAGEEWLAAEDYDRAAVAYSMALPLLKLSRSVLPATLLDAMAGVDIARHFLARALVRLEQSIRALPELTEVGDDPLSWIAQVNLVSSVVGTESRRATSSVTGVGLNGLERSIERLRRLAALPGVPSTNVTDSVLRDAPELLRQLAASNKAANLSDLMSPSASDQMLAMTAQIVRDQIAETTTLVALSRGRVLQRAGSTTEAERCFGQALELVDVGLPAHRWLGVLACVAAGREHEALLRFKHLRDANVLPDGLLAPLAVRARDYETASRLFAKLDVDQVPAELPWPDLANRAELAIETGDAQRALAYATAALERFEEIIATLGRDPDRVAACDDVQVTGLYVTAARAALAIAERCERDGAFEKRHANIARSFEVSDRGHALALATLVAGAAQAADDDALGRRWQQSATEWSAAFERLLAAYDANADANDGKTDAKPAAGLTIADAGLVRMEADIEARKHGTLAAARRLPLPVGMAAVQTALPPGSCLVQYHVVGRDLLIWGLTSNQARGHHLRLAATGVEPLVGAVWRACSTGACGEEGHELAELLLAPVAELVSGCDRLVVVPFGPLAGVPFHALPFDGASLGDTRVVSYLPAASMLAGRTLDERICGSAALVVGDPAFAAELHPSLRRLPGAGVEARACGRCWGKSAILLDADAREDRVRALLPDRPIVHLAAHGYLDEIAPSNSSIVLACTDSLTVSALIGLRLPAQLAVLSACDTGRGAVTLGGDVIGLTRGLLAAGVQRAVVSLWPVDDIAACVTMHILHERLADESAPAHALAQAQTAVRGMSGKQIATHYASIGGSTVAGARTVRRSGGRPRATGRQLALDAEFVDSDDPEGEPLEELDGKLERIWAPFILVGA